MIFSASNQAISEAPKNQHQQSNDFAFIISTSTKPIFSASNSICSESQLNFSTLLFPHTYSPAPIYTALFTPSQIAIQDPQESMEEFY